VIDDLVQETLVACVVARHALRCEDALLGYVYAVARRVLVHQHHGRVGTVAFDEDSTGDEGAPSRLDHHLDVQRLLSACPSRYTRLVVLRYVEGHHGVEIARDLRISEASVRRQLRRGPAELQRSASPPTRP
jgi:RNA polymerase sigma factor (sigma-70 family)